MIARMICRLFGHKRGVRTGQFDRIAQFKCPRCNQVWRRKVYARKGKA